MLLLSGSLFLLQRFGFDMGLGMMRMFCFTHVYMIPLWMIVVACAGEHRRGWVQRLFSFLYSFLFFSLGLSWVGLFFIAFPSFGGYRLKCRAINYSFFHHWALDSYILVISTLVLGLGFWIGPFFLDISFALFLEREEERLRTLLVLLATIGVLCYFIAGSKNP